MATQAVATEATLHVIEQKLLDDVIEQTFQSWTQPYEVALKDAYQTLREILPGQSEAFIKAVWLQFRKTPELQKCTPESIQAAAVLLAQSGLDITQPGEVWLIPMRNRKKQGQPTECVVWDGYLGRLKLARQANGVLDADGKVVRANDTYQFNGDFALPNHQHPPNFQPRGDIIGAYAVVWFADGRVKVLQMSIDEIRAHKTQYARSQQGEAWQEHLQNGKENRGFQHMAVKIVCNQLCHPRHIPMVRSAAAIVAIQQDRLDDATPLNGYSPPVATTVPTPTDADAHGDTAADERPPPPTEEELTRLKRQTCQSEIRHLVRDFGLMTADFVAWYDEGAEGMLLKDAPLATLQGIQYHLETWQADALGHALGEMPDAGDDPHEADWAENPSDNPNDLAITEPTLPGMEVPAVPERVQEDF